MQQNRWNSPVLWGAIVAQVLSILVLTGVLDITQSQTINVVVAAILQMLVAFGVINDPTSKNTL